MIYVPNGGLLIFLPAVYLLFTGKRRTFCLFALAGLTSFDTDLSGMALTFIIILTIRCLAVDLAGRGRLSHHITVGSAFALFEAVTASLLCRFCGISSHSNRIQITIKILVMHACLHGTF